MSSRWNSSTAAVQTVCTDIVLGSVISLPLKSARKSYQLVSPEHQSKCWKCIYGFLGAAPCFLCQCREFGKYYVLHGTCIDFKLQMSNLPRTRLFEVILGKKSKSNITTITPRGLLCPQELLRNGSFVWVWDGDRTACAHLLWFLERRFPNNLWCCRQFYGEMIQGCCFFSWWLCSKQLIT